MLDLVQVSALTEDEARETIERIRWPNGPICPHCGSVENITKFRPRAEREVAPSGGARAGVFKCNACKGQFTVTVGSIFEDSHIPLRTWLMAFALICSAKKGVSALQLQRQLGLGSYRTAWFMAMRIREAMKREPLASLLKGTVEAHETYVGGEPRPKAGVPKSKRWCGTKRRRLWRLSSGTAGLAPARPQRVDAKTLKGRHPRKRGSDVADRDRRVEGVSCNRKGVCRGP